MSELFDKTGRPIARGDILKVFHFAGPRQKRYFMYKQALGTKTLGGDEKYMMFSHLAMTDEHYLEHCDGRTLSDYEIVQSIDARFQDRPRGNEFIDRQRAHRDVRKIVNWATTLKSQTDDGAMLFINGELWEPPLVWWISDTNISVSSGCCSFTLWSSDQGDTVDETIADLSSGRLRVLVDAAKSRR